MALDILSAIEPLRRKPLEEHTGRTPPDWDLKDKDGQGFFLELVVRPDSGEEWLEFLDSQAGRRNKAYARGLARSQTVTNGRRKRKGGVVPTSTDALSNELERFYLENLGRSRDEKREDVEKYLAAVREILLLEAYAVPTDQEPADAAEIRKPIKDAVAKIERLERLYGEAVTEDGPAAELDAAEAELERATKEVGDRLEASRWLRVRGASGVRQALSADEIGAFMRPELPDDGERTVIPKTWSYGDGFERVTLGQAVAAVVRDLANLATEGVKAAREQEIDRGKDSRTSGRVAPQKRARRKTKGRVTASAGA